MNYQTFLLVSFKEPKVNLTSFLFYKKLKYETLASLLYIFLQVSRTVSSLDMEAENTELSGAAADELPVENAELLRAEAEELHERLREDGDYFESGLLRFLPWPELRTPPRSVRARSVPSKRSIFTFSCIGRKCVKELEGALMGCFKLDRRMLIGNLGSGKTHLLALTISHHYKLFQVNHRVAAIFTMPRDLAEAFRVVRRALLVAYGDKHNTLDSILALRNREELIDFVGKMDSLVFVVDAWNEADREVQDWMGRVLDASTGYLQGTTTIPGSRSIVHAREEIELFSRLTTEELVNFLALNEVYLFGSDDSEQMEFVERFTGRVPLFVSIFCKCYEKLRKYPPHIVIPELEKLFRGDNDVAEMEACISYCESPRLEEFTELGVCNVKQLQDIDIRYVVKEDSMFHPVTPFATELFRARQHS